MKIFRFILRTRSLAKLSLATVLFAATALAQQEDPAPQSPAAKPEIKRVLLLGQGPDGHPRSTHEYMAGMKILEKCLRDVPNLQVQVVQADGAWEEGPALLKDADSVVLFLSQGAKWMHGDQRRLESFALLAARGGGIVSLHWAMGAKEARYIDGYLKLVGGCHGGPDRKYKVVEADVRVSQKDHPVTAGIANFHVHEEFYYKLKFVQSTPPITPLLQASIEGQQETVAWAWERPDGGRSCGFSGGHFHENWQRIEYRRLLAQATLWSLKLPIPADGLPVEVTDADLALPDK